jgi:hypothetical protein
MPHKAKGSHMTEVRNLSRKVRRCTIVGHKITGASTEGGYPRIRSPLTRLQAEFFLGKAFSAQEEQKKGNDVSVFT